VGGLRCRSNRLTNRCWRLARLGVMRTLSEPLGPWVADAACRGCETHLFFPNRRDLESIQRAKEVCLSCPVLESCRRWALGRPRERGIWGGTTERERQRIRERARVAQQG
jgi:WhiB family redox-sensing transcriptional regulator